LQVVRTGVRIRGGLLFEGERLAPGFHVTVRVGLMQRSPEAEELRADLYRQIDEGPDGGLYGAITARADAQVLRLSVTYALTNGSPVIELPHLEAAWALWRYATASCRLIFGDSTGNLRADKLLSAIRSRGSAGLDREGQHKVLTNNVTAEELNVLRKLLVRQGHIRLESRETGGRSAEVAVATTASL
jgi:hypothetical protein